MTIASFSEKLLARSSISYQVDVIVSKLTWKNKRITSFQMMQVKSHKIEQKLRLHSHREALNKTRRRETSFLSIITMSMLQRH